MYFIELNDNKKSTFNHWQSSHQTTTTTTRCLQSSTHDLPNKTIVLFVIFIILKVCKSLQNRHSAVRIQLLPKAMIQQKQRILHSHPLAIPSHIESHWTDREEAAAQTDKSIPE